MQRLRHIGSKINNCSSLMSSAAYFHAGLIRQQALLLSDSNSDGLCYHSQGEVHPRTGHESPQRV
jgi:hypothetical protein